MILGVVLCGGKSSRMGRDKGLLSAGSKRWAEHAFSKLRKLGIPVVVSINKTQLEAYSRFFSNDQLIVDSVSTKGPLKGLLSVHAAFPEHDLLLLACDMVDMDVPTLQSLKETFEFNNRSSAYYVYELEGFVEPLCAIYPARTLQSLKLKLSAGKLPYLSLQRLISESVYLALPIQDSRKFANYNSDNPFS